MNPRTTICLVTIFRNEENYIGELIRSCEGYIDYAIFLDSDSTDNSHEVIRQEMGGLGVPFEIHNFNEPFRGDTKRTRAIQLAYEKADYLLVMDADNTLEILPDAILDHMGNPFQSLYDNAYLLTKKMDALEYPLLCLFNGFMEWEYVGVIHDYPQLKGGGAFTQGAALPGVIIHEPQKGERGRVKTQMDFYADALKIENEFLRLGADISPLLQSRYAFYLGRSYFDARMWDRAITAYRARVSMGIWDEEIYYSLYDIARALNEKEAPKHEIFLAFMQAWEYRPQRCEAAYMLMVICNENNWYHTAYAIGKHWQSLTCTDTLFVSTDVRDKLLPELLQELEKKINGTFAPPVPGEIAK